MDNDLIKDKESSVQMSTNDVNSNEIWEIIDKEDDGKKKIITSPLSPPKKKKYQIYSNVY